MGGEALTVGPHDGVSALDNRRQEAGLSLSEKVALREPGRGPSSGTKLPAP